MNRYFPATVGVAIASLLVALPAPLHARTPVVAAMNHSTTRALAAVCGGSKKRGQQEAGRVQAVQRGMTVVSPHERARKASRALRLYQGDTIKTGKGQRGGLQVCDGGVIYLNQDTTVTLPSQHVVQLRTGEVDELLAPQDSDTLRTGQVSSKPLGLSPTDADTKVSTAGVTLAAVRGAMTVVGTGGSVTVGAGQQTTVKSGGAPGSPTPVDAAATTRWASPLGPSSAPPGTTGSWALFGPPGQIARPNGLALAPNGNLYVADTNNNRIVELTPNGQQVAAFGSSGADPGQFSYPEGVTVDGAGNVYVAEWGNNRIQKLSGSGTPLLQIGTGGTGPGQFSQVSSIALDAQGNIYAGDYGTNLVQKLAPDGSFLNEWGGTGSDPGRFDAVYGVAVDTGGNVYVADSDNYRIQKLSSAGTFLKQWGTQGDAAGQFDVLETLTVDPHGNVFTGEEGRIQEFSPDGVPLGQWGTQGAGAGQFADAAGIAVDTRGDIYVADNNNNRLEKFTVNG